MSRNESRFPSIERFATHQAKAHTQGKHVTRPVSADNNNSAVTPISIEHQPSGVFSWILATDTVYCDGSAAKSFGFSPAEIQHGLPIKAFLDRMHPDDRPDVAKAIREAIVTGQPYQEDYRICRSDGSIITVTAFGSCFRDETGEPSYYAGIIVPIDGGTAEDENLIELCMRAYRAAKRSEHWNVSDKLLEILREITTDEEAKTNFRRSHRGH